MDFPTDLGALQALHRSAPGHVYIHLGGRTPEEPQVGRSLMHSKLFLAVDDDRQGRLWVGSHNLTAMALQGGNIEAGLTFTGPTSSTVVQGAVEHLEACRATAELFDPNTVKVITSANGRCLYFSRYPLPYIQQVDKRPRHEQAVFYKHIGVYLFTWRGLRRFAS